MQATELYASVTAQLVAALESGDLPPWRQPWKAGSSGFLPMRHSDVAYRGVNVLILWAEGASKGYSSSHWMTFAQAKDYGGSVRKGEKSTAILFCQPMTKDTVKADGSQGKDSFWISKTYRVFNADQIDGLPDRFTTKPVHQIDQEQRIAHAETFIGNTKADIRHANGGAFYRPSTDSISLPPFETFDNPEAYYATALHELSHWTGHGSRLNRDLKGFGTNREDYSREEIIAELSSVFVCAALGITPPDMGQHAAYIDCWVKALKADPRYIFSAASKAQAAADYLMSLQPSLPAGQRPLAINNHE